MKLLARGDGDSADQVGDGAIEYDGEARGKEKPGEAEGMEGQGRARDLEVHSGS